MEHTGKEKLFSCGLCGKAFNKQFQLSDHLNKHVSNGPPQAKEPQEITCELCNHGFPNSDTLFEHLIEHVAEEEYQLLLLFDQIDSSNDLDQLQQLLFRPISA